MKSPLTNGHKGKTARKYHISAIFIWSMANLMQSPYGAGMATEHTEIATANLCMFLKKLLDYIQIFILLWILPFPLTLLINLTYDLWIGGQD